MSSLQKFHRRTNPFQVNTLHTGTISISGTAAVGSVLTATNNIADVDGLGTFNYQWKRSGSAISGATSSTYTLVSADASNTITVTITYTDGKGFIETETSAATATVTAPNYFPSIGAGNGTVGYWIGTAGDGSSKLIIGPKTSEVLANDSRCGWGSDGTIRGTTNITNGLPNTNTLASFGSAAHPAAYYCKSLTTGGYNTWYLPAKNELVTIMANRNSAPFSSSADKFMTGNMWISSSEVSSTNYWGASSNATPGYYGIAKTRIDLIIRPVRAV